MRYSLLSFGTRMRARALDWTFALRTQISSCNKAATTAPPFLFLPSPFDFEYEYEPLDELIATPPLHTMRMLLPVHLWASGRVALLRNTPRLSLSNPTVGGPSKDPPKLENRKSWHVWRRKEVLRIKVALRVSFYKKKFWWNCAVSPLNPTMELDDSNQ